MEEAEQKRRNGEIAADITPEQAAKDAEQAWFHCNKIGKLNCDMLSCTCSNGCISLSVSVERVFTVVYVCILGKRTLREQQNCINMT